MQYYPAYLELRGRPCLVIGGGEIAARKITTLPDRSAENAREARAARGPG